MRKIITMNKAIPMAIYMQSLMAIMKKKSMKKMMKKVKKNPQMKRKMTRMTQQYAKMTSTMDLLSYRKS